MGNKQHRSAKLSLEQQQRERARKERKQRRRQQRETTRRVPYLDSGRKLEAKRNRVHLAANEPWRDMPDYKIPPEHAGRAVRARLAEFWSYFWPAFVFILLVAIAWALLDYFAEAL